MLVIKQSCKQLFFFVCFFTCLFWCCVTFVLQGCLHPGQHFFFFLLAIFPLWTLSISLHHVYDDNKDNLIWIILKHFIPTFKYISVYESKKDKEPSRSEAEHADKHFLMLHVTKSGWTIIILFFGCRFDPSALQPAPSPSGRWICAQCYGNRWQRLGRTSGLVIHCAGHSGGGRRE